MKKVNVKRIMIVTAVVILTAILFYFIGYSAGADRNTDEQPYTFYATIMDIQNDALRVKGMDVNDINFRGEFTFSVRNDTKLTWRYTDIKYEDLIVGDNISITFTGEIAESYPARIQHVTAIQLLSDRLE